MFITKHLKIYSNFTKTRNSSSVLLYKFFPGAHLLRFNWKRQKMIKHVENLI